MWDMTPRLDLVSILGCTPEEAVRLLHGRPVTPGEVEAAARIHYDWRRHINDPDSYWVTITQASRILGMRPKAVRKLLDGKRLPHITHATGVRLMRRHEIEAIARQSPHQVIPSMARA
jgi:CRP-like cAMP-binding protein